MSLLAVNRSFEKKLFNAGLTLLVSIAVFASFGVLRTILPDIFGVRMPSFGLRMPLLFPVLLMLLTFNFINPAKRLVFFPLKLVFGDLLFASMIIAWLAFDMYRLLFNYGVVAEDLIYSYFWLYFFIFLLRSFQLQNAYQQELNFDVQNVVCITTLALLLCLTLLQFSNYLYLMTTPHGQKNIIIHRPIAPQINASAYRSLLGIYLWMFFSPKLNNWGYRILQVGFFMNILMILINKTRGAFLLMLIFALIYYKKTIKNGFIHSYLFMKSNVKTYPKLCLVLLCLFAYGLYSTPAIQIAKNYLGETETVKNFSVNDVVKVATLGRGLIHEKKTSSTRMRIDSAIAMLEGLYQSPFIGVGLHGVMSLRHLGTLAHVHYEIILVAYGILGFILYLSWFLSFADLSQLFSCNTHLATYALIFGQLSFDPYLNWWISIPLFLLGSSMGKFMQTHPDEKATSTALVYQTH